MLELESELKFKKFKKCLQILALGSALTVLTACSSTGTGANTNGADDTANGGGVATGGLGGDNGNDLSNPNAMVPGANQRYFFDFDKSDVHSSDLPSMKVQAQYLISHPSAKVSSQGNTDVRGSREYNIALGQRRANAVKKVLLLDGAPANQMSTVSYGAEKPVATGNSETDYAQNRRVDLIYVQH